MCAYVCEGEEKKKKRPNLVNKEREREERRRDECFYEREKTHIFLTDWPDR